MPRKSSRGEQTRSTLKDRAQPHQHRLQPRNNDGKCNTQHYLGVALVISVLFNLRSLYNSSQNGEFSTSANRLEKSLKGWKVVDQFPQNVSAGETEPLPVARVEAPVRFKNTTATQEDYETRFKRVDAIYKQFRKQHYVRPNRGKCFNPTVQKRENLSASIEFIGCCGLGHRLARMAASAHIAADFECPFFGFWGCCDNKVSVFHYLFGDAPLIVGPLFERRNASQVNHHLQFISETPGFRMINGKKLKNLCPLREEKVISDYRFYSQLRDHYHNKAKIDAFVHDKFHGRTVLGLHVRAGNGEGGDFEKKGRGVGDAEAFVKILSRSIKEMVRTKLKENHKPPILFVATDTHSMITSLAEELNDTMPVLDMPQIRKPEGEGVFFGEKGDVMMGSKDGSSCLDGWDGAVGDMILLSYSDILLVPKTSSFTQTMPASLVMGKPDRLKDAFCELEKTGQQPTWRCFDSVKDWSCGTVAVKPTLFDASLDHRHIL